MRELAKRAVALAGHGRTFRRRLPADLGGAWFLASLEGGVKFLRRDLYRADRTLMRFAAQHVRPGSNVWDVGANVGLFTFAAAGLGARVLAVEADTWLAGNLRRAASQQHLAIDVLPVAISSEWGVEKFVIARTTRATNYLAAAGGSTMTGGVREYQYVPTAPLDALMASFGPPDIVKIDIEGGEVAALRGGQQMLAARPVILIEVYEFHRDAAHELLAPHGYSYRDADSGQPIERPTYNTVAFVPGVSKALTIAT